MDAYWRAANYLSVGQIYLYDNPLLKQALTKDHIKPRLLGHWGTTPGLNFIYVHLNRVIKKNDLDVIYITGPGHGGPGLVANAYLEGTYSEVYPNISPDEAGMKRLMIEIVLPHNGRTHYGSVYTRAKRFGLSTRMVRTPLPAIRSSMAAKPTRSATGSAPLIAAS